MGGRMRGDGVIGIGLLGLCAFMAWRTSLISAVGTSGSAGPTLIPWMMIGGIAILSVCLIFRDPAGRPVPARLSRAAMLRIAGLLVLLIAYAAAFSTLGYLVSTLVTFVAGLALFGERRPLVLLLVPAAVTVAVYFGFTRMLNVWLP